ncbi:MAG: hypothetical protein NVSMB66_7860 [Candidatus Doudnabacteria bacterium]
MAVRLKFLNRVHSLSTQGHFSGGRVEDTKAFEITIVKELGKMAP